MRKIFTISLKPDVTCSDLLTYFGARTMKVDYDRTTRTLEVIDVVY